MADTANASKASTAEVGSAPPFIHLHTHSEYSLLDGAARIPSLVERAAAMGMEALALTDHGVMYGTVPFVQACKDAGVKPIVGCEVYVTPGSRHDRPQRADHKMYHLLLLAESETGYRNLMKVSSKAFLDGFYYKPRADKELLAEHSEGLIALSACLTGEVPRLIINGDMDGARRVALEYRDIFGPANFFLELMDQGLPEQVTANAGLMRLSEQTGIPLVVTNDAHYVHQEEHEAQDLLLCIQTGTTLDEEERLRFHTDQFYLKSAAEMAQRFPDHGEALARTVEIAERCDVPFSFGSLHLPDFDVPEGETLDSYLADRVWQGVRERYGEPSEEVRTRTTGELAVIADKGFSGYFLIVSDFVRYAREHGIMVGPGRGSAAGSIVSYALGITKLDPIEGGLLFERFLNPERMSMPDIDIDFDDEQRDRVISYVRERYGDDHVAQIITFSTMKARAAIRDAARVLGQPFSVGDKLAKMIVPGTQGAEGTIETSLRKNPELREAYDSDETARRVLDAARFVEGLSRQDSIHAAGVVISEKPLTEYVPLQRKAEDGEIVTQYDMGAIASLGLLKMDFLGLRTLTVLAHTVRLVERNHGVVIDLDAIPFDDEATMELYRRADTMGVFQVESPGMRALLTNMQPSSFSEIVALIALYRPGPIQTGMIDDFVARKHGRKAIEYPDERLEPFLAETYGTIVYQEQVMQIAQTLAGFTPGEADDLREAMGKKKVDKMAKLEQKFVAGLVASGWPEPQARKLFADIAEFAGYAFNKSHSAAYAVVSFQTAYLKAHYRPEFMAALLTSIMSDKDKVLAYVNDCRAAGLEVLPPDVNESHYHFAATLDGRVRFGLTALRNVGEGLAEAIVGEREARGPFASIFEFCARVCADKLNKRALESLVKAGAFDSCGQTRKHNLDVFEQACDAGAARQRDAAAGQVSIFDMGEEHGIDLGSTPEPPADPTELDREDLLAFEKEMLGVYVSDHPLRGLEEVLRRATDFSSADYLEQRDGTFGWIAGIASEVKKKATRRGDLMLTMRLEDLEGSVEVTVFPKTYLECGSLCEDDARLRIKAKLDIRDEGKPQALAQEIQLLSTHADDYPARGPLRIRVPDARADDGTLDALKVTLRKHSGDADVFVHLMHEEGMDVFRLGPRYRVNPSMELMAEIDGLLGGAAASLG